MVKSDNKLGKYMKTKFEQRRGVTLTKEEFTILILNYPIYLICVLDFRKLNKLNALAFKII